VLPVVLDTLISPLSSVLISFGLVAFVLFRYWGLLVRLRAIEASLDDLHARLLSRKRSQASLARWNAEGEDDAAIQAALARAGSSNPIAPSSGREPWWRKHRGL
jgi:hypothetical protein